MLDFVDLVDYEPVDFFVAGGNYLPLRAHNGEDVPLSWDDVGFTDLIDLHQILDDLPFMARGDLEEDEGLLISCHLRFAACEWLKTLAGRKGWIEELGCV